MADYRRKLVEEHRRIIHDQFKDHLGAYGGIFTEDKRRKLLGVKAKPTKQDDKKESPDFWYDVRTNVKNGFKDLRLFCYVAHPEQVKDID